MQLKTVFSAIIALAFVVVGTIAATSQPPATAPATAVDIEYFELVNNGNPLNLEDWVVSETDPQCPTTVSAVPCRIRATADGNHPEAMEFASIKSLSNDFTQEYTAKVTYKP